MTTSSLADRGEGDIHARTPAVRAHLTPFAHALTHVLVLSSKTGLAPQLTLQVLVLSQATVLARECCCLRAAAVLSCGALCALARRLSRAALVLARRARPACRCRTTGVTGAQEGSLTITILIIHHSRVRIHFNMVLATVGIVGLIIRP